MLFTFKHRIVCHGADYQTLWAAHCSIVQDLISPMYNPDLTMADASPPTRLTCRAVRSVHAVAVSQLTDRSHSCTHLGLIQSQPQSNYVSRSKMATLQLFGAAWSWNRMQKQSQKLHSGKLGARALSSQECGGESQFGPTLLLTEAGRLHWIEEI